MVDIAETLHSESDETAPLHLVSAVCHAHQGQLILCLHTTNARHNGNHNTLIVQN